MESRSKFDKGTMSEPLMLRNLFVAWLRGLHPQTGDEKKVCNLNAEHSFDFILNFGF